MENFVHLTIKEVISQFSAFVSKELQNILCCQILGKLEEITPHLVVCVLGTEHTQIFAVKCEIAKNSELKCVFDGTAYLFFDSCF